MAVQDLGRKTDLRIKADSNKRLNKDFSMKCRGGVPRCSILRISMIGKVLLHVFGQLQLNLTTLRLPSAHY
jgi:hypothetical protein